MGLQIVAEKTGEGNVRSSGRRVGACGLVIASGYCKCLVSISVPPIRAEDANQVNGGECAGRVVVAVVVVSL